MIGVTIKIYELNMGSSILSRRGRTLPKAPERLYCEIGMLALWVPTFWKILETVNKTKLSLVPAIRTLGKPCMGLGLVGYSGTLEIELGPGGSPRDSGA